MKVNIGRYLPGNSLIHRMDARVKLLANIAFITLFFTANNFILQGFLIFPVIIAFIMVTKNPLKLFKTFKLPLWVGFFMFLINAFVLSKDGEFLELTPDVHLTWDNWMNYNLVNWNGWFTINRKVIITTLNIIFRIYAVILIMTVLTAATPPVVLTKALDFYLHPLSLIRIPTHIFIMIISIALRFVPTIVDESQRILKAQASRGTDFKNGGLKTKAKATIVLIVPLFVSAFSKAEDLANAMETRGYDPYAKRSSYRAWTYWWFDISALIVILGIIIITSIIIVGGVIPLPDWWGLAFNG